MWISGIGLFGLLISPYLVSWLIPYNKSDLWRSSGLKNGCYSYIADELDKDEPIDVLFIGSSSGWTSLNPEIIEDQLGKTFNREVTALNLSTNWFATDIRFFMLKDLLEKRKVKLVIFGQNHFGSANDLGSDFWPHPMLISSFNYPEYSEFLSELSAVDRFKLYAISVFGSFKHIGDFIFQRNNYSLLSPNPIRDCDPEKMDQYRGVHWTNPGFISQTSENIEYENSPVAHERVPVLEVESMFYNNIENQFFENIKDRTYIDYHSVFIKEMHKLCVKNGSAFAMLKIPISMEDFTLNNQLHKKSRILRLFQDEDYSFPVIGVAQERLYEGLSREEILKLHHNETHHAKVGADYYTTAIMPAISKLYRDTIKP